jgi:hypothetical protein
MADATYYLKTLGKLKISLLERDTGVEPVFSPWKGGVEPLN